MSKWMTEEAEQSAKLGESGRVEKIMENVLLSRAACHSWQILAEPN
jgi:hypothetical protein